MAIILKMTRIGTEILIIAKVIILL